MRHPTRAAQIVLLVALVSLAPLFAGGAEQDTEEKAPATTGIWDRVLTLYEAAKEAGEQVPKDVYAWVKQDFGKIGDWEYLVTDLSLSDTDAVQRRLNELGSERWECIWIHTSGKKTSFIFKRPAKSYLRNIPLPQLMNLIPGGGSDSSGE